MVPIDRLNWRQSLDITARPEEMHFIADYQPVALVVLSKCYVRPQQQKWFPFAFELDGRLIGVCALALSEHRGELYHLLVDRSVRRRGHGRAALLLIIDYIRTKQPACLELQLTVHDENVVAQSLYATAGFEKTEEARDGENVWRVSLRH